MNTWTRVWMVLWVGLLVVGCGAQRALPAPEAPEAPGAPSAMALDESAPAMESASTGMPMPSLAPAAAANASGDGKVAAAPAEGVNAKSGADKDDRVQVEGARPLLIYEAHLKMRVDRGGIPKTIEQIIDIAEANGGYLLSRSDQAVQVRVPSQALRDSVSKVESGGEVLGRSVTAQDVSEQYHDLQVRLRSLEAVRDRLQQFLGRATNVAEAMEIGKQLDVVGQQIDQVKGRMRYLQTRAAFSLLSVALEEKPEVVVVQPPPPSPPPSPKAARLPVPWLQEVGLDTLTRLPEQD